MCWEAKKKEYLVKHIAEEDIPTFKIVKGTGGHKFLPIYFPNVYYVIGVVQQSLKELTVLDGTWAYAGSGVINEGFHSYKENYIATEFSGLAIWVMSKSYALDHIVRDGEYYKLSCVIPKGATYYENEHGEFVSNAILPVDATFVGKINLMERRNRVEKEIDVLINKT